MLALGQRHPQRLSRPASRAWALVSSAGVIASSRPRYQRKVQTIRTQPVVCAQPQRSSALEQDASPREPEEPEQEMSQLQLVLPISWELQIDEVVAKYENMDERLDAMERQLLEMTREMRTSTASLTGGVTTISSGGTAGLPATSGLSNAVIAPSEGEAADSSAHVDKSGKPAPVAINDKSKSHVHASGTTERGTAHSGGLISPELNEREQIIEQGKAAAAIAKAAQEEEERAEQEEQEGGQRKEKKAKQQAPEEESGEQYKGGLWDSPLQQALGTAMQALNDVPQALIDSIPTPSGVEQQKHKQHKPRPPPQQQQQQQAGPPGAKKPPAAEAAAQTSVDGEDAALKDQQVDAVRERLLQQAQARAAGSATQGSRDDDHAEGTTSTKPTVKSSEKQGGTQGTAPPAEDWEHQQRKSHKQLLDRESLYGFNRLQSAITELANSGYIESVKQLRETLLIQEWDMSNRHLAKRRGVAMFERYVAERDLVHEIGGFAVISALYEDPDALDDLLPNDRMKMLARSMMEECLNERRMQLYYSCNQTAKDMATLTSSGMSSRLLVPLRTGLAGAAFRIWGMIRSTFLPWTRFLPFV